jgi:paraquat-inducible protein B
MGKKANPKLIGVFVLGAVVLLVAGIMIFGSGRFFQKKDTYVLFFEADVKGLTLGAPVTLKGVQIGSVTGVKLLFDRELLRFRTAVYVEILPDTVTEIPAAGGVSVRDMVEGGTQEMVDMFIQRGLRGVLQMQSFVTGKLQVAMEFRPGTSVYLEGLDKRYPEIPTIPSELQQLAKKLESLKIDELVDKAVHAVESIDKLVSSPDLAESVSNLNLALKDVRKLVQDLDREVKPLSTGVQVTLKDARKLLNSADGQVTRLSDSAVETLESAQSALEEAEEMLETVNEEVIGERAALRYQLVVALDEMSRAFRAVRLLVEYLEQRPDALLRGKGGLGGK